MSLLWALLLVLAVFAFWTSNLFGLPGNWLILAATGLYAWLVPAPNDGVGRWWVVGILAALAVTGEVVEVVASAAGVKRVGGSRRGAFLALLGSLIGALAGVSVGVPIPVVGSAVAAVLFGGLGALIGAMLGEFSAGRSVGTSWAVGRAAFRGRLYGTLAKTLIGAVMAAVAIVVLLM